MGSIVADVTSDNMSTEKNPTMKCRFWTEIRTKNQDGTLENMLSVRLSKVHKLLQNIQNMCGTNMTYPWMIMEWLGHSYLGQQEERY